jgi:hypothetical protein
VHISAHGRGRAIAPETMVNASLTMFVGTRESRCPYKGRMAPLFIHGRVALADASELIEHFGDNAGFEAAARAELSRDLGNVARFCHWRQIERVIATLSSDEIVGTVH